MKRRQEPGPGPDGEERDSSPSSSPETGKQCRSERPAIAAGFAEGGTADVMDPGAELAGLVTTVTGPDGKLLGTLTDQEVLGVLGAVQRLAALAAWGELVTLAEFARRRLAGTTDSAAARVAAEEAAWKTSESWARMLDQASHAVAVTTRLPQTLAALRQGKVSDYKVKIVEAQTADLSEEDAAKADVLLAAAAQVKNPAGLRDFARRQVARLDPQAAARKKERARRDAYVRAFQEDSGNMGLSAREMPSADGVIAWQNIEQRALDLHAAGIEGTSGQLQVRAMLDFLLGRATPGRGARQDAHADGGEGACHSAHAHGGGRGGWAVNAVLVVPWDPAVGEPSGPAELPGFGLLDEDDTMDLLTAAGQNPATRWCLTMTGQDGTAAAHGCIPGRRTLADITSPSLAGASSLDLAAALKARLMPIAKGACNHAHFEPGYRPSRRLRHLVAARNARCTAPGCGRSAAASDRDHTEPWEDGGITCECNLSPLCRHHHQIKQAQGWKLEQKEPGVLVWSSPAGLTRTTTPTRYPD